MKLINRTVVLALFCTVAAAGTLTHQALVAQPARNSGTILTAEGASLLPVPTCPPDDPTGCQEDPNPK